MNPEELHRELIELARVAGFEVRQASGRAGADRDLPIASGVCRVHGSVWVILAGLERFAVEFFRAKDDRFFGILTLAQVISLLLVGLGFWLMRRSEALRGDGPAAA